jgi:predicted transcriptional regulator
MDIILSVKPKYLKRIYRGTKSIEIRKQIPRKLKPNELVWFYESGTGVITGIGRYQGYKIVTPKEALEFYSDQMDVTETEFRDYVGDTTELVLLRFKWVANLNTKIPLSNFGLKRAPQSYCYIDD